MTPDPVLQVSVERGVARLTLDSPANRNALSRAMLAQLRGAVEDALADDAVRVLVLDHTGRVFCSGMDLSEAAGAGAGEQGVHAFPDLLDRALDLAQAGPRRGPRTGAGRRHRADGRLRRRGRRRLRDVRGQRGAARAGAGRDLGRAAAADGAAPAAPAGAHRGGVRPGPGARAAGLVDLAVADDEVDATVEAQVAALAAGAPAALAETKRLLRAGGLPGLRGAAGDLGPVLRREEGQEGIAAFRGKRPARWVP